MTSRGLAALSTDVVSVTDMRGLPSKGRPSVAFTPRIVLHPERLSLHQVHALDQVVHPGAHHRLGLVPQSRQGGDRPAGDAGYVIKDSWTIGHCMILQDSETAFLAAQPPVYSAAMILITGGAG